MARRSSRSRRRPNRAAKHAWLWGLLPRRRGRRFAGVALVLVVGAWLLGVDMASWLPDPAADAVREAEAWLEDVRQEVEDALPPTAVERLEAEAEDWASVAQALDHLSLLAVVPERPQGYDRGDWRHWLDVDGDCQDARQEVLAAESLEPVRWSADGCDVEAGLWRDLYTGETVHDPRALDVDHMVPLAEAHRSGGREWSPERRAAFANDLDDSRSLVAVSASANRSKGDQGPEDWLPPEDGFRCRYAAAWVAVKARWSLAMDERERVVVGNLLEACLRT